MISLFRIAALAISVSLLALTLNKQNADLALLLTLGGCTAVAGWILVQAEPVLELFARLAGKTGLPGELTVPLFKATGLGMLTQISAAVCQDAGQSALAKLVELGGGILCIVVSLPLFESVLALVESML